jgi:hypothetical protein
MPSRRGDDLRGHIEIGIGRRFADPIFQLGPDDELLKIQTDFDVCAAPNFWSARRPE